MKKRLNKKGFTLIELIVVIAILAILAAILIPALSGYIAGANKSKDEANARTLYSEIMLKLATDVAVASPQTLGDTTCEFTVANAAVATYACENAAGAVVDVTSWFRP